MSERSLDKTQDRSKERRHMRLKDEVPVELRRLDADQATELAARLAAAPTLTGGSPEPLLARLDETNAPVAALGRLLLERLALIEEGLARLTERIAPEATRSGAGWAPGQTVDLSESGLGVVTALVCSPEDRLEIRFRLPDGGGQIRVVGSVVKVISPDGQDLPVGRYRLSITFEAIHPADRQALTRAIFRRHRALLRDRHRDQTE
jgi:hypothetical protein